MRIKANVMLVLAGSLSVAAALSAQASGTMPTHTNMATPDSAGLRSLLTSPLGSRGPWGFAVLSGKTLRLEWSGDQPGSARPWSMRRGSCARDEGELNASPKLAPLTVDASGKASQSPELEAPVPSGKVYLVVHYSSTDSQPIVLACGSLANGAAVEASPSGMDHSAMDHSGMEMDAAKAGLRTENAGMSGMEMVGSANDSLSSRLIAIHTRMMADPVIRERVLTDPVLQRMIRYMHADTSQLKMPGTAVAPKTPTAQTTARSAAVKAAASKPTAKPVPLPAAPAMPEMDHSKMPGMKKPPV